MWHPSYFIPSSDGYKMSKLNCANSVTCMHTSKNILRQWRPASIFTLYNRGTWAFMSANECKTCLKHAKGLCTLQIQGVAKTLYLQLTKCFPIRCDDQSNAWNSVPSNGKCVVNCYLIALYLLMDSPETMARISMKYSVGSKETCNLLV